MFTWICPECGREVPPHFTECPDCAEKKKGQPASAPGAQPPAQPPAVPSAATSVPPRTLAAAPVAAKGHVPAWLVTLIVAVILIGLGALFFYYLPSKRTENADARSQTGLEQPALPQSPLARHVEVTGFRITEDAKQRARIRFVVVNHSGAELADLSGNVSLKPVTAKPEDPPMASFTFKIKTLEAYQVKDLEEDVKMKLRAYELPDWQFLKADIRITAP